MSFQSNSSKFQAESTVNKLFSNILHSASTSTHKNNNSPLSTTQILSNQLNNKPKIVKKRKNIDKIKKQADKDKKFAKFIKYNLIKDKKDRTDEENKYYKKLIRKNVNQINKVSKIDDFEIDQELSEIKSDLLNEIAPKAHKRNRNRRNDSKNFTSFEKNTTGPGLTPGLAPVDYDESDDE